MHLAVYSGSMKNKGFTSFDISRVAGHGKSLGIVLSVVLLFLVLALARRAEGQGNGNPQNLSSHYQHVQLRANNYQTWDIPVPATDTPIRFEVSLNQATS